MSSAQGMLGGAAQGASAGTAFGPWGAAIGGVVGAVGGLFGSRSAKKAAEAQRRAREAQALAMETQGREVQGAYNTFGQNMFDLAGGVDERYQFNPIAARGPFGQVSYQDGTLVNDISPAGNMLMQGGQDALSRAMSFDRAGAEADYFKNMQALYGDARNQQSQALLRQLQSKGMAGLGSNVNGNMLMKGMMSNWANQDLQATKMAMDYGGAELDRAFQRGYGMFNQAQNMGNYNMNMWQAGQGAASPFQLGALNQYYGLMQRGYGAPLQGTLSAADFMTNAANIRAGGQINQAAARDAANQGLIGGIVEGAKNIPWGQLGGMFGSNPLAGNMFSRPSGNVDAVLAAGGGTGPW